MRIFEERNYQSYRIWDLEEEVEQSVEKFMELAQIFDELVNCRKATPRVRLLIHDVRGHLEKLISKVSNAEKSTALVAEVVETTSDDVDRSKIVEMNDLVYLSNGHKIQFGRAKTSTDPLVIFHDTRHVLADSILGASIGERIELLNGKEVTIEGIGKLAMLTE
ncbi:hypothetical protein [Parasedimentitalea huanghaiensis]|uniref:Uncharacterized protein n=1 Tax=Parasedimentitalea huanghaiensis TaxID=2682100 RepID=A0A6L6WLR3_9RHOB|nr:hypothetical protein [Zongyanglinia huanghaiensis]MVO18148.1 hypothetical protein [Zongyanglinia huanghaiensis]